MSEMEKIEFIKLPVDIESMLAKARRGKQTIVCAPRCYGKSSFKRYVAEAVKAGLIKLPGSEKL